MKEYESAITEGKELKNKTGKKGEENTAIKDRLEVKQRATQYLIDGEEAYISGDYQKAQESYQKAIKEAKKEMDFYDLLNQESLTTKQQTVPRCELCGIINGSSRGTSRIKRLCRGGGKL